MSIQEKIVEEYPLIKKALNSIDIYKIEKRKYVLFWKEFVNKKSVLDVLNFVKDQVNTDDFEEWKTIIIVAPTLDCFQCSELLYFDNQNTYCVFYLIDKEKNKIFMDDKWIFPLGLNYKKSVRKIDNIVKKHIHEPMY